MRAFVLAAHIENFCHKAPRHSEFVFSQFVSFASPPDRDRPASAGLYF
jgi:hypothetical protein